MTRWQRKEEALDLISRVRNLELKAREVAEGALIGLHRSRHRGSSIEFSEHKAYSPGDEIRLIDWKLFGKTDRYFIKQFEDETRIETYLLVDASGSMAYPEAGGINKFEYSRVLAGAISYLLLGQGDAVGAALINHGEFMFAPARSGEKHFSELVEIMAKAEPAGATRLGPLILELANRIKKRSLIILISDFFDPENEIETSLKLLRHSGNELVLFQVLSKEEMEFPFDRLSWFEGLEGEGRVLIDPQQLRKKYMKLLKEWREKLERICQELAADYELFRIDESPSTLLSAYLLYRSQTQRRRARV
jgi:uncharacterized protein (DUF58 family)